VRSRCRKKSLFSDSSIKTNKVWYFRCPNCGLPGVFVTHLMYGACGGRRCRGKFYLPHYEISRSEYERCWGK
jgi:hypothetical protein